MGYLTYEVPEGWEYEGPDESVGIFGYSVWHEACPSWQEDKDCTPSEVLTLKYIPKEGYTEIIIRTRFTCPFCGEHADMYEQDVAPDDDYDEEWN